MPFYLCEGDIKAVFTATVSYTESNSNDKRGGTSTRYVTSGPHTLDTSFDLNKTQIYAGYKYNIGHIHTALRSEQIPLQMIKLPSVDTSGATLNLFEQSTTTMKDFLQQEVRRQAQETAQAMVRQFHPAANSISVEFSQFEIRLEAITPCFVPCYVIKANYDEQEYHLFVAGLTGKVGGPFLINALYAGRATALAVAASCLLFSPNKATGVVFAAVGAVAGYYIAFYAAKYFPQYRRDYLRNKRDQLRKKYQLNDAGGYRPDINSKRRTEEYHHSTYWDDHAYEKKKTNRNQNINSNNKRSIIRDPKQYYRTLELNGDESVNEIRSAYRKLVLKNHPDVGGSTADMTKINEAYRVLRDPARREAYDRSG
ncbi:DnaJ domain containing protein, putative [Angomonas deanei]|uniref:DnaJ domain containing protein, putative n=1 Tax=Angomonas deanei TaxID=59799 RepID=A0A7G2CLT2_9TRYP|nr:DnaJ domain containing protein, putative [Angomonas deanei]